MLFQPYSLKRNVGEKLKSGHFYDHKETTLHHGSLRAFFSEEVNVPRYLLFILVS